jgi:hypothetical protein
VSKGQYLQAPNNSTPGHVKRCEHNMEAISCILMDQTR